MKLTSIDFASAVTLNSLIHIVNTGDTSQSPDGSSYKSPLSNVIALFSGGPTTDTYVTGFTYNNANAFTISQNEGQPDLTATLNTVTGLTVNGTLSASTVLATTISASTVLATTISAITIDATSLTVNGSPINTGSTALTWVTRTDANSATYTLPSANIAIINEYQLTPYSEYTLPATANIGDKVLIVDNKSISSETRIKPNAGQTIVVSGIGYVTPPGRIECPNIQNPITLLPARNGTIEFTYVATNRWVVTNFLYIDTGYNWANLTIV